MADPFDAESAAARWLAGEAPPAFTSDVALLALAWALKHHAYAVMYSDLDLAGRAAVCIRSLVASAPPGAVQHEVQALGDWVGGAVAVLQGRAAQAVTHLDAAYEAFESLHAQAHAAASQVPKIAALSMLGRHDDALACGKRTLAQFIAAGDERSAGKVEINLGSMLALQHRHAESAAHFRRAAVLFAHVGDRQHSVMADVGLAGALSWQFQFDEALRIYRRANARVRAHGLPMLRGIVDSSRGLMELHRGRYAAALRWLESALGEFERTGTPQRLAEARMDLGAAYLALNLLPEAMDLYELAAQGCRLHDAPLEQAWALAQLGVALGRLGRLDAAQARLMQARDLFQARGREVGAASVELRAAALYLHAGAPARAHECAEAAAAGLADSGMRGWWLEARMVAAESLVALAHHDVAWASLTAVLAHAQAEGLPDLLARCHTALGLQLQRGGDRPGARHHFEAAASAIESQQAGLQGDEFRTSYGSDKQAAFDALIELELDERGTAESLFGCVERARARALSLGLQTLDGYAGSRPQEGASAEPWRDSLHWLQQQWQHAATAGDRSRASTLQRRMQEVESQALQAQHRGQAAAQAGSSRVPATPPLALVQAALGSHQALVEYAQAGGRLLAIVALRDQTFALELDATGLSASVQRLRLQLDALRFGAPALRKHDAQLLSRTTAHLQALHGRLWAPLAGWLAGIEHVIVVPCGELHYLPFCALHDGQQALVERCAISLAPSAALWLSTATAERRPLRSALVLGVGGASLPNVRQEAKVVADVFAPLSRCLIDGEATLLALREAAPTVDLLHLACHGRFRADSPYFSALELGDGGLTLREAATLQLRGATVTLSACETALSRVAPGDEVVGLVRGFFLAGATSVLASLWTVDDASTATLMAAYYRALLEGKTPAVALRQAQLALRRAHPHPFFWAAFTAYGAA